MAEVASEKVFNNPHLLNRILHYVYPHGASSGITEIKEFIGQRLVDPRFDCGVLATIRDNFKTADLFLQRIQGANRYQNSYMYRWNGIEYESDSIGVELREATQKMADFLNNVACVNVREVSLDIKDNMRRELLEFFHNMILDQILLPNKKNLQKLLLDDEFCYGCDKCIDLADKCKSHNVLSVKKLEIGFPPSSSYQDLYISYNQLHRIATNYEGCEDKESYLREVTNLIKSNITCDHLVIVLPRKSGIFLPKEVLKIILHQWKVNSITSVFQSYVYKSMMKELEIISRSSSHITNLRIDDAEMDGMNSIGCMLESVHIDATLAGSISHYILLKPTLVRNIQSIFQTHNMKISLARRPALENVGNHAALLLRTLNTSKQRNVNCKIFIPFWHIVESKSDAWFAAISTSLDHFTDQSAVLQSVHTTMKSGKQWRSFKFHNPDWNNSIRLNIHVEEQVLRAHSIENFYKPTTTSHVTL